MTVHPQRSLSEQDRTVQNDTENRLSTNDSLAVDFEILLELFGDEYACELLCSLAEGPKTARTLIDQCGMSRPTVYRRLDRLTEAGVVVSQPTETTDCEQRTMYHLVIDCVEFLVDSDGVSGAVGPTAPQR